MSQKKKARLGRGLGALLGEVAPPAGDRQPAAAPAAGASLRQLPIERLSRGKYQPRVRMDKDALAELAESIRVQGVVQPLLVRELASGQYEIVAGERRWRGAQLAGLTEVPVVVRDIDDQGAMAVALIENIQREDLNAMEEARGFQRLLEEFGLTHEQIAGAVGRSRTAVSNLLRLLALNPAVQRRLEAGELEMGHARALLALPAEAQPAAAGRVVDGGLSVRATEQLVKRLLKGGDDRPSASPVNADVARLEEELSTRLGARVAVRHGRKGGQVVIQYHSLDELDGILERLRQEKS